MPETHDQHVLGGYKATLHNSNTSNEAKAHAADVLRDSGVDVEYTSPSASPIKAAKELSEHEKHQLAGFKAAVSNRNVSEEAKQHALQEIAKLDAKPHGFDEARKHASSEDKSHYNHVIGGYKATLHNERTSEEAKAHARQMLRAEGIDPDEI